MTKINRRYQRGFTITELMLAMGGIAFLLLFVVFAIVHVMGLYTKGVAIKQINQSGRQLTEEITRAVRYGSEVRMLNDNRLCVGGKSYLWNTASTLPANVVKYDDSAHSDPPVVFVTVDDGTYCDSAKKVPLTARKGIDSSVATLQEMSVTQTSATLPVYDVRIVLSTSGDNAPDVAVASGVRTYTCSPQFGQFCAFGDFSTMVYARRQ